MALSPPGGRIDTLLKLPLFAALSTDQRRAALSPHPRLVVLAGAGSGKTRVLVARLAWLLWGEPSLPPSSILAVTFTRKACAEMRARLGAVERELREALPDSQEVGGGGPQIDTFHAAALKALRRDPGGAPRILDEGEERALLAEFLREEPMLSARRLTVERLIDGLARPGLFTREERGHLKDRLRAFRLARGVAHLDDLVPRARALLEVGSASFRPPRALLVDEFQDVDAEQLALFEALVAGGAHFAVFGDDDQAIYRWRGSEPDGLRRLARRPDVEVTHLPTNYRSTPAIVELAGEVIQRDPDRLEKPTHAHRSPGPRPRCVLAPDLLRQLTKEVQATHRRGRPWEQIAILVRDHQDEAEVQRALRLAGIPDREGPRLLTYHAAKGLEFPVVILPWLEKGRFPGTRRLQRDEANLKEELERCLEAQRAYRRALARSPRGGPGGRQRGALDYLLDLVLLWLGRLLKAPHPPPPSGDDLAVLREASLRLPAVQEAMAHWPRERAEILAEERRLCFVAITRAQDELIVLARARERLSPFLAELPPRLLRWEEIEEDERPPSERPGRPGATTAPTPPHPPVRGRRARESG